MTDKKSSESRRKLLKSIAAGSGAIVAGKSLPDSWSRPIVDSVMLPAHALTSACSTILVDFNITVTGVISGDGAGYSIYPAGSCDELDGDGGSIGDGVDFTATHTYGPGQYVVRAGFSGTVDVDSSITGVITVSCCNGDTVTVADETITTGTDGDLGCALVTLGEDGTCMVELLPAPCPCNT